LTTRLCTEVATVEKFEKIRYRWEYVCGILVKDTVPVAVEIDVVEISSLVADPATPVSQDNPEEADDTEVIIFVSKPSGTLDLEDPSKVRMSPFALCGLRLISDCVGILPHTI
jgi:hypothetical protein